MIILWLMSFIIGVSISTHTTIKPDGVICIGIDVELGDKIQWNMESIPDKENLNCAIYFLKTSTSPIVNKPIDTFTSNIKNLSADSKGTYLMCVNNTSDTPQTMIFSYKLENPNTFNISDITTISDTERIEAVSKLLLEKTHEISEKLGINKTKERIYSDLSKKMNSRILWWSIAHFIVLVSLCFTQIYYINSFFEVKTRV